MIGGNHSFGYSVGLLSIVLCKVYSLAASPADEGQEIIPLEDTSWSASGA